MLNTNFPPWPSYSDEEIDAVAAVLKSNRVNQWTGNEVRSFEREFSDFVECKFSVALSNGTVALDLALLALGIKEGDEVIVTPRTFIASVSSVVTMGAIPVFADVDLNTQNMSISSIERAITKNTKAIIIVHLAGMPANMDEIMALANKYDIRVIEDCAQAHGAMWGDKHVGTIGDIGAWSFCQDKIMTTGGEGGMITTNNEDIWKKIWSYKDHGKNYEAVFETEHGSGFRWLHDSFGTNARMTEIQAVIGRIQTRRMPVWHRKRLNFATRIWDVCRKMSWLRVPEIDSLATHAAYKCYVFVRPENLPQGWNRDSVIEKISKMGVPVFQGSCSEVYKEKAFENTGWRPEKCLPNAKELGETSLMFLVHPTLEEIHIEKTIDAIKKIDRMLINNSMRVRAAEM